MISDTPYFDDDEMGLLMLLGVLGTARLLVLYRKTRNKRYLSACIGAMLLAAAAGVYAFTEVLPLFVVICIPALVILVTNVPLRLLFRRPDQRWEPSRADPTEPKCENCGYDLRGTFAADIYACPECNQRARDAVINAWRDAASSDKTEAPSSRPGADS